MRRIFRTVRKIKIITRNVYLRRPKLLNVTSIPSLGIGLLGGRKQSPDGLKRRSPLSPIKAKNGDIELLPSSAIYEAESPDELALVHAARAYDVKLIKRTPRIAIVSFPDKSTLAFEILHVSVHNESLANNTNDKISYTYFIFFVLCV